MKIRQIILASFLVLAAGISTACNPLTGNNNPQTTEVTRGNMSVKVNGNGKTGVVTEARLMFGTAGRVETVAAKEGDRVKKGAVLAKLETDSLELGVLQAETAATQAELAQTQALNAVGQTQMVVSQAQTAEAQAEVALEAARFDLNRMKEVDDIKKKIIAADQRLTVAQEGMKAASLGNDLTTNQYWQRQILSAVQDKKDAEKALSDLLSTERFKTLTVVSQTVPEAAIKQRQVDAAQQSVDQAKLAIDQANLDVQQAKLTVEQTKRSADQAKKAVEVAKKLLKDATITAPFDALVVTVDIKEGEVVAGPAMGAKPAVHLVDPATMEVKAEIDEIDIANVKLNQRALVTLDAVPGVQFEGKVTQISMVPIQKQAGVVAYQVKIGLVTLPEIQLRVGMSASTDIIVKELKDVLLVPSKAIKHDTQNKPYVEVKQGEKIERIPVVLGATDGINTEIVGGLNSGALLVTKSNSAKS